MFVKQILLEEVGNVLLQSKADLLFTIIKIGEGNGNPLQYSCLENPMDRGVWQATVHGAAKNPTGLND